MPAPVAGSVWKILVEPGATVAQGQVVIVIETMKMEMEITAPLAGRVREILCRTGHVVQLGQRLAVLQSA